MLENRKRVIKINYCSETTSKKTSIVLHTCSNMKRTF